MAKTIIVIEDDQNTRKLYLDRFKKEGFNVMTTPTGEEGLSYIQKKSPDIILLDILLSGEMDGFTVLQKLKESDDLKDIPVLVLSNVELEKAEIKKLGAKDYLIKADISLEDVVQKLKQLLN